MGGSSLGLHDKCERAFNITNKYSAINQINISFCLPHTILANTLVMEFQLSISLCSSAIELKSDFYQLGCCLRLIRSRCCEVFTFLHFLRLVLLLFEEAYASLHTRLPTSPLSGPKNLSLNRILVSLISLQPLEADSSPSFSLSPNFCL